MVLRRKRKVALKQASLSKKAGRAVGGKLSRKLFKGRKGRKQLLSLREWKNRIAIFASLLSLGGLLLMGAILASSLGSCSSASRREGRATAAAWTATSSPSTCTSKTTVATTSTPPPSWATTVIRPLDPQIIRYIRWLTRQWVRMPIGWTERTRKQTTRSFREALYITRRPVSGQSKGRRAPPSPGSIRKGERQELVRPRCPARVLV